MKGLNRLVQLIGMGVLFAAVYREMQKPPEERTWHGTIADFVPYDLRVPTLARARARLWNPDDDRVLMPTVFGVGWTVNLASVSEMLKRAAQ
jgi:hypothetical protein